MANNNTSHDNETCHVRSALQRSLQHRQASLTQAERTFLSALLIDKPPTVEDEEVHKKKIENATKVLNDDILFSVPMTLAAVPKKDERGTDKKAEHEATIEVSNHKPPKPPKPTRSNEAQLDLWRSHGDGVEPKLLGSLTTDSQIDNGDNAVKHHRRKKSGASLLMKQAKKEQATKQGEVDIDINSLDVPSDQEVGSINDESTASSWNSSQGGFDHYNAWEVIRDEYAEDFGFNVAVDDENQILPCPVGDDDDDGEGSDQRGMFKILGTNADDTMALPHDRI